MDVSSLKLILENTNKTLKVLTDDTEKIIKKNKFYQ